MIAFRGSRGRRSEPSGLRTRLGVAVVSGVAAVACSEGSTEPPADTAGTSSMSGSGGNATGNNGGSGNAAGGMSGSSGSGGTGGSTGGGNVDPSTFYYFETSAQGFRINYVCTAAAVCMSIQPGMGPAPVDAGDAAAPTGEPDNGLATATFDPAVGNPDPGSVKVEIDFTAPGQIAVLALNFDTTDFTGRTMSALVTVEDGAPAQLVGKMYMKTGETYVYADSGEKPLPAGTWTPFSISADLPMSVANGTHNAADTREIGIEFATPGATAFSTAVIHVDTWQY
jgi:hypothetical protein